VILSAIQTKDGAELRIAKPGQIRSVSYPTILGARRALIAIEREVLGRHPEARNVTQMQGEDLIVCIKGLPAEPERQAKRRTAPDPHDDPKAFYRWRLGVIRRAVESIREELSEATLEEVEI